MLLGADTGYLLAVGRKQARASEVWDGVEAGEHQLIISTVVIAEYLAYHIPRGALVGAEEFVQRLQIVPNITIMPVSLNVAIHSARYRVGLQIPTIDSIILATYLEAGCALILTTDPDIALAQERNLIDVELLVIG